jgi:hypothetical protein
MTITKHRQPRRAFGFYEKKKTQQMEKEALSMIMPKLLEIGEEKHVYCSQ